MYLLVLSLTKRSVKSRGGGGHYEDSNLLIHWNGNPSLDLSSFPFSDQQNIRPWLESLKGNFQIAIFVKSTNEAYFIVDRTSSMPFYYSTINGVIRIDGEPLKMSDGKIRETSVFEFLASGHLWGSETFLENVKRLSPGYYIYSNSEKKMESYSYWSMDFRYKKISNGNGEIQLNEAIDKDIDLLPRKKAILTLSGGYDSRALLGLLHEADFDFECVSYNFGDDFDTSSDYSVGQYYASKLGIKHHHYNAIINNGTEVASRIKQCIKKTGGESDTAVAQDAMLGPDFYRWLSDNSDYMIRGDEVWGWGDHVLTWRMAFWQVFLLRLYQMPHVEKILKPEALEIADEFLEKRFIDLRIEARPDDLKDYLYWKHRESRLLQNMAYYRRQFIDHYAPFIFGNSLDVIRSRPPKDRCNKHLFKETMKQRFPELFLDCMHPSSLRPKRSRMDKLLSNEVFMDFVRSEFATPSKTFEKFVDTYRLRKWINEISIEKSSQKAKSRYNMFRTIYGLIRKSPTTLSFITASGVQSGKIKFPVVPANFLFRLLTLNIALKEYEKITFEM
jgi:hypothetical protein